jgi:hypothetical protein
MKVVLKRMVRLRPLAVTMAIVAIDIASKECSLGGAIDRISRFVFAYALVAWAMMPNAKDHGRTPESTAQPLVGLLRLK